MSDASFNPAALILTRISSGGNTAKLQWFLIVSTMFLYLIAAGLFSKSVWFFQNHRWTQLTGGDASESGSGPGSYDIRQSVWHVNCCNPELNGGGGWGIFNSILGWENSATYGSVISYNLYWLVVIIAFVSLGYYEKRGHWPLMKAKSQPSDDEAVDSDQTSRDDEKKGEVEVTATRTDSREIAA